MPKAIKGTVQRRPPEPSANRSEIDDWLGRQMPSLQPIVQAVDGSIRAMVPGLHYAIKWKRPYYGLPELGWIIELAAYDVSVNVVFFGGADFDTPPPLGTADRTRYVKLTTLEEARRPELQNWIEQASRTPGWGLAIATLRSVGRVTRSSAVRNVLEGLVAVDVDDPHVLGLEVCRTASSLSGSIGAAPPHVDRVTGRLHASMAVTWAIRRPRNDRAAHDR
jgi:hypothetical protein